MKVCIDCRYVGVRPSGIGEAVAGLIAEIPALAPDLDFLLLRSPHHPGRLSEASNVQEVVVRPVANGPATMWWLPNVVDLRGVALFHATFNILPARMPMPCITTIHDVMWLTHPNLCNASAYGRVERVFHRHGIRRALRKSAAVATVSAASRDEIIRIEPDAAARVFVTQSGVSDDFKPAPATQATLERLGLRRGRRYVLTVGQYAPYKNHEGAIRAFALAFGSRSDIDLVLVQRRAPGSEGLLEIASQLGLAGRLHILPMIERQSLIALYSSAEVLLHPSLCEGFGNPLAEAMACGTPIVTSNRSAMPEVTGGAALLADPTDAVALADALREVVDNPALQSKMRGDGQARAAELSWASFAAANLEIYRRILAGGR